MAGLLTCFISTPSQLIQPVAEVAEILSNYETETYSYGDSP